MTDIERIAYEADPFGKDGMLYYAATDTPETLQRFYDLVRNEVLEEAAKVCDERSMFSSCAAESDTIYDCAAAIRALKVKT